ncbi:MAG: lipopolysaccharide biosynthesis protein [Thermogutta sp.]
MQPELSSDAIRQAVRRGGSAVFLAQVASQLLSLIFLGILLRQLGLIPYGWMGMAAPLLVLVRILIHSGLDVAAIQQRRLDDRQISALFWVNQILGVLGAVAVASAAPLMVRLYGEPQLFALTIALAGTMPATTLGAQHQALLQRHLRLGALSVIRLIAQAASGLAAVAAAFAGWGVWALVVQQYAELLLTSLLAWWVEPWRPRWVLRNTGSRGLLTFGGHYTLSNLLFFFPANLDKILIGSWLGPAALAVYGQAFNLAQKPVGLVAAPLITVMLPTLSRSRFRPDEYRRWFAAFLRFLAWLMLPCGVGLALVAPEVMLVLGGAEWAAAGPILRVFALMIPFQACFNVLGSVFSSVGRADRMALGSFAVAGGSAVVFTAAMMLLQGHPDGAFLFAAVYVALFCLVLFPPYLGWALRTAGLEWTSVLTPVKDVLPPTLGMAGPVLALHAAGSWAWPASPWILAPVEVLTGAAVYLLLSRRQLRYYLREGFRGFLPQAEGKVADAGRTPTPSDPP